MGDLEIVEKKLKAALVEVQNINDQNLSKNEYSKNVISKNNLSKKPLLLFCPAIDHTDISIAIKAQSCCIIIQKTNFEVEMDIPSTVRQELVALITCCIAFGNNIEFYVADEEIMRLIALMQKSFHSVMRQQNLDLLAVLFIMLNEKSISVKFQEALDETHRNVLLGAVMDPLLKKSPSVAKESVGCEEARSQEKDSGAQAEESVSGKNTAPSSGTSAAAKESAKTDEPALLASQEQILSLGLPFLQEYLSKKSSKLSACVSSLIERNRPALALYKPLISEQPDGSAMKAYIREEGNTIDVLLKLGKAQKALRFQLSNSTKQRRYVAAVFLVLYFNPGQERFSFWFWDRSVIDLLDDFAQFFVTGNFLQQRWLEKRAFYSVVDILISIAVHCARKRWSYGMTRENVRMKAPMLRFKDLVVLSLTSRRRNRSKAKEQEETSSERTADPPQDSDIDGALQQAINKQIVLSRPAKVSVAEPNQKVCSTYYGTLSTEEQIKLKLLLSKFDFSKVELHTLNNDG